jgi:DNA polymerase-1
MPPDPACLYLVDGSSYVYRAFFALPPLQSPNGLPTNAVYGFTTMLLKLLADTRAEYMGVVFDAPGPTFRDDLFAAYKANRPSAPDDLTSQMPLVRQVVEAFRLRCLSVTGVEADDVIATLVTGLAGDCVDCVIVTGDKDMMQLVGPRVRLWDTMRDRWTDSAAVEARFGVEPSQVLDVMALMGDPIDNIPGVKGIGEKTAVALIRRFGDLETVLGHLEEVERMELRGARTVAARLREGAAMARLSRELANMRRDVPLDCRLDDFRVIEPDRAALGGLLQELGFQSLLRQLGATSAPVAAATVRAHDVEQVRELGRRAEASGWLAFASVPEPGPAVTTPVRELVLAAADGPVLCASLADTELCRAVGELLQAPAFELVVHDLKGEILRFGARDMPIGERVFDVMIASYLTGATATHGLDELAAGVLGVTVPPFRADAAGAAAGASVLGALRADLRQRLRDLDLTPLFDDVEMPLARVLAQIERRGMLIDVPLLRAMGEELAARLDALMKEIFELAGGEFNINSPPQLRTVLFERLALPKRGVRRGKTGYSTDVDVLTRLQREHPLPGKILEYRALAKLKSTYVDALLAAVHPETGRLHTSLNQTVAATGRLSSSEPNLQNIPVRGEEGKRIREAFIAPAGHVLLAADYSQIELRVLAHLSRDPALIDAFTTDQDIHTRTASEVFGVLPGLVTAEMRRAAKVINFGILYGMGPQRLAQELAISVAEAERYIASYFERYAGVRTYMQSVVSEARARGFVTTILGRRRIVSDLGSSDRGAQQAAERVATNTPVQGSAADLIKLAMVNVDRRLRREALPGAMILQIHDELLLEVVRGEENRVGQAVREEMEGVMPLAVPLRVDLGVGQTWAGAH